jgi:hypothetical protein
MKIIGCLSVSVETFDESSLTRNVLTEQLPSNGLLGIYLLQWERALCEPLASSVLPFWLHYSGLQAVFTESLPGSGHIRYNVQLLLI